MFDNLPDNSDVVIIGAGPSGAAMASWLAEREIYALVIESQQFPRFTIGESLLPEAINCLEAAGLLEAVESGAFQYKDGALFATNEEQFSFNFSDSFTPGKHYAYQVPRADFDKRLIDCCIEKGVQVCYQTSVSDVNAIEGGGYRLNLESNGETRTINSKFLVDASGFGRVLARKLNLDKPSGFAEKSALFCHLEVDLDLAGFDRNKILIAQTEKQSSTWYWLIPFAGNTCSAGVVTGFRDPASVTSLEDDFRQHLSKQLLMSKLVGESKLLRKVGRISAYSSSISSLYGDRYVILGNAGEFIDPIFSSGVTIALKSAMLAAPLVAATINGGKQPDWHNEFQHPLMEGVNTFREYVAAWYAGILPRLFYTPEKSEEIYHMMCGVLAGYVWDRSNPYTRMTVSRLDSLLSLTES